MTIEVSPALLMAIAAARAFDDAAYEELKRLGEEAERTGDYRRRDERSADLGEQAWEHLGALLALLPGDNTPK